MAEAIRSLIVPLPPGDEEAILSWAERLSKDFDATCDALFVREDWKKSAAMLGTNGFGLYFTDAVLDQLEEASREAETRARAAFEDAAERTLSKRFGKFIHVVDEPALGLARVARGYDLAIALAPVGPAAANRERLLNAFLIEAGTPVFVAPPAAPADIKFNTVVLAWDASREASHAMRAAVAFFKRAKRVRVVHLQRHDGLDDPVGGALTFLKAHGVEAEAASLDARAMHAGDALLVETRSADAGLLVMGAYGQPQWMEHIFGGATHEVLASSEIPILMAH